MTMTIAERFNNLETLIQQNRIIRGKFFSHDENGRKTFCLLSALFPELEGDYVIETDVIPQWLAHVTPHINDRVSDYRFHEIINQYLSVCRAAAHTLDEHGWKRAENRVKVGICRAVMKYVQSQSCQQVIEEADEDDQIHSLKWMELRNFASVQKQYLHHSMNALNAARCANDASQLHAEAVSNAASAFAMTFTYNDGDRKKRWDKVADIVIQSIDKEMKS